MKYTVALAGNPNCGKTTLFNELTGSNGYVGNWPGVTVEKKAANLKADKEVEVVDLPGIYSLSPYSPEEVVARDFLTSHEASVIINIIDATNLERNLYLTTQLLEVGTPVVVALNMQDLLEKTGDKVDAAALSAKLGCPVVSISALKRTGLDGLLKTVATQVNTPAPEALVKEFSQPVKEALGQISKVIAPSVEDARNLAFYSIKLFERDEEIAAKLALSADQASKVEAVVEKCATAFQDDPDSIITCERYDWIGEIIPDVIKKAPKELTTSEKIDKIVTNRWLGIPIFLAVMVFVYYIAVSTVGTVATDWANDGLFGDGWYLTPGAQDAYDEAMEAYEAGELPEEPELDEFGSWVPGIPVIVGEWLENANASPWVESLVIDGIIGGVGSILGFVPQMFILFVMLCFLEDCGYMSRVAFVMDRAFRRFGLSGKSFIPLLISSGCGVPGIMSTKTIENENDRRMTIMLTTMIPCGAKTPIIALLMGALIGGTENWWVAPLFYVMGLAAVIISAIMLKKTKYFAGDVAPFVMELPAYHLPALRPYLMHVWERVKSFIAKAGTIIFAASVGIWFLSQFGWASWEGGSGAFAYLPGIADAPETYMDYSLLAMVGGALAWIFSPLGFGNWQATASSISALIAKENLVSTFGVLYGLGEVTEESAVLWSGFAQMFTTSGGVLHLGAMFAFVAFNMLDAPCFAAMGTIRRQMNSRFWFWFAIIYQCGFGWVVGLIINQFYEFFALGNFGFWTVVALVLCAAMLFQLFRPTPDYSKKADAKLQLG
jgi:ferrous iron transport protein B